MQNQHTLQMHKIRKRTYHQAVCFAAVCFRQEAPIIFVFDNVKIILCRSFQNVCRQKQYCPRSHQINNSPVSLNNKLSSEFFIRRIYVYFSLKCLLPKAEKAPVDMFVGCARITSIPSRFICLRNSLSSHWFSRF